MIDERLLIFGLFKFESNLWDCKIFLWVKIALTVFSSRYKSYNLAHGLREEMIDKFPNLRLSEWSVRNWNTNSAMRVLIPNHYCNTCTSVCSHGNMWIFRRFLFNAFVMTHLFSYYLTIGRLQFWSWN